MMTPTKMKLRVRKKESGARSSRRLLAEMSPDSKCPICLDRFNNVASLDRCLHRFCFRCIHEWSKNKAECPLCKQPFRSIFHSVKAENDFKEFVLASVENGPAVLPAGQVDSIPSGRVRRPRASRGGERRSRRQQNPAPSTTVEGLREVRQEALHLEHGVHHMMLRLTGRRRSQVEERSLRRLRDQDVVAFRRALYRTGLRVRCTGLDGGRQRDVSAAHLRRNPVMLRRLLPWLQRELTVLYGSHGSLVSIVQHIIMSRITNYDMEEAAIRDELRPFLLARTDHFLHEMVSFARSALSIEAYDQQAVYECPAPSYEEDSGSNSSIIAISEDDDGEEVNISEDVLQEGVPLVPMAAGGESSLSQSAWDDETPGPSYSTHSQAEEESTVDVVQADGVGSASGAAGPNEDDEEECMIVGYVKPMAERTPELVQLSSDSSEEEQEAVAAETVVPKAEASSSQVQEPTSPESYRRPISPSSCPHPSASCSPGLQSPQLRPQRGENDTGRPSGHRGEEHTRQRGVGDRSRSNSGSSVLSGNSERCRTHRSSGSGSRCQVQGSHQESQKGSPQSSAVSVGSSESSSSPGWEWPHSRSQSRPQRSDEDLELTRSTPTRERASQSSVHWVPPGHHSSERKKARKKRREKDREKSRSPLRDRSVSHNRGRDSRRRQEPRLPTAGRSGRSGSSSSSSSSSLDSSQDRPCPEKPAGKRKYKTRHLERAAQRQSSRKSIRDREQGEAHGSPAKRQRRAEPQRSRSPSVEIIYERRASDTHRHRQRRKRHKKKSWRETRAQNPPPIITIDSDSDTNDCGTAAISRTTDYQEHAVEATNSKIQHRVIKTTPCLSEHQHRVLESNCRTSEEQNLSTTAVHRTTEEQHHEPKTVHRTTEEQNLSTTAVHRTTEEQNLSTKTVHRTTEEQSLSTKTVHRTTEEQNLSTSAVHRTTEEQNLSTKTVHRTTEEQNLSTKTVHRTTEEQNLSTKTVHRTTEEQNLSTKTVRRTSEEQNHVTSCTPDDPHPVVQVTSSTPDHHLHVPGYKQKAWVNVAGRAGDCQETAVSMEDQSVEGTDPIPDAPLGPSTEPVYGPVSPSEHLLHSPDRALNLDHCVVDVVDRHPFHLKRPGTASDPCQDVSVTTTPSDTRLLESILQELEDILPEEEQGAESGHQPESRVSLRRERPHVEREAGGTQSTVITSDSQRGAENRPTV